MAAREHLLDQARQFNSPALTASNQLNLFDFAEARLIHQQTLSPWNPDLSAGLA
jgi:hypothetical protein